MTAPTEYLTNADIELLIAAAQNAAADDGIPISVAVLDAGGILLGFRRDDQAVLISAETSARKAYTALQLATPTADVVEAVKPAGPLHGLPTALSQPLLFISGGAPIIRGGRAIGAVGIGGGSPEQDGAYAAAAVNAL